LTDLGHARADTLITPLNDSFLDIDVLARIDRQRRLVLGPSGYAQMVSRQSEHRVANGQEPIDWLVMRNRLAQLDARNTRDMAGLLGQLSERMGFRLQPGLSERVVYRELFFSGLTLLDQSEPLERTQGDTRSSRRRRNPARDPALPALTAWGRP
jgi:chromosome partitioning protein